MNSENGISVAEALSSGMHGRERIDGISKGQ